MPAKIRISEQKNKFICIFSSGSTFKKGTKRSEKYQQKGEGFAASRGEPLYLIEKSLILLTSEFYTSQPMAEAPRTAALAPSRPLTRNLALFLKILRTWAS